MMEQRITSRKNPLLQQVKKLLSSKKAREEAGLFVSDGTKLLQEGIFPGGYSLFHHSFCTASRAILSPSTTIISPLQIP